MGYRGRPDACRSRPRMPPAQPCPNCRREGVWLPLSSHQTFVNYYRCASGHVWNRPKSDPAGPVWFVTEVPSQPTATE